MMMTTLQVVEKPTNVGVAWPLHCEGQTQINDAPGMARTKAETWLRRAVKLLQ